MLCSLMSPGSSSQYVFLWLTSTHSSSLKHHFLKEVFFLSLHGKTSMCFSNSLYFPHCDIQWQVLSHLFPLLVFMVDEDTILISLTIKSSISNKIPAHNIHMC